ncbi:MAG: hypothetical protein U0625_01520 [Phycisphaerales bacterium]
MQLAVLPLFLVLCLLSLSRPANAFLFMVVFFALEVSLQASVDVFRSYPWLANVMVGMAVLFATVRAIFVEDRPFAGYFTPTTWLVLALFAWSLVTLMWTPATSDRHNTGYSIISEAWPYFILVVLMMPLLMDTMDDLHRVFTWLLVVGSIIVVTILVNPEFTMKLGRIGISLDSKTRTSPLAIGQMGGTLAIVGALYLPPRATRTSLVIRVGAFLLGCLLALYSGSRGQVIFSGLVIAMFLPLARQIRNVGAFIGTVVGIGVLAGLGYIAFGLVSGEADIDRWASGKLMDAGDVRAGNILELIRVFSITPTAWVVGLGFNAFSAVCNDLGQGYSHCTFVDVLCELGIPAFGVLMAMLWTVYKSGRRLFERFRDDPIDRAAVATLLAMVFYQILIANKEGNLWASVNLFMYCIVISRLEVRTRGEGALAADEEGYEEWAATEAAGHEHAEPALPAGARA